MLSTRKPNTDEVQSIPEIMSFFGLDAAVDIIPISGGIANHNYLVKTTQGEYVVKFLVSQTVKSIENDVSIQKQLKHGGMDFPQYLQNKDGVYIFDHHNIHAVISKKIEGVTPRVVNQNLAYDFGQKLAIFHKLVVLLPHPKHKGLMNPENSGIHSPIFAQSLPVGIIHGDFHLGNVLVEPLNKDRIIAILDFEEAGENFYLVDLAVTIMAICSSADENAVDQNLIQSAINGYKSIRKLSAGENASFSEAVTYSAKVWIKWFTENGYVKYAEKHRKRLNSFLLYHQKRPRM